MASKPYSIFSILLKYPHLPWNTARMEVLFFMAFTFNKHLINSILTSTRINLSKIAYLCSMKIIFRYSLTKN